MRVDPDDIDAVFRMRHEIKVEADASTALAALDDLRHRDGDTVGLAFNRGLCLYELNDLPAAHASFRAVLAFPDVSTKLRSFVVDGAELVLKTIDGPPPTDTIDGICTLARSFDPAQRDRFLTYLLYRDASTATFDLFWRVLETSPLPAFAQPAQDGILRLLFARCSAQRAEERFFAALAGDRLAPLRDSDEATLVRLLHTDEYRDDLWQETLSELLLKTVPSNRDAMDLALIALGKLDDEAARNIIESLVEQSPHNWGVVRALGTLAERAGDRTAAMSFYDRAARQELAIHQVGVPATNGGASPRISAVALSFNDGPLVSHFCRMIAAHCDELVVNDGGSTDDTVALFRRFAEETGFPVHVIEDVQHGNRERTIFTKEGYRGKGLGGVLGFDADRRRTTTLVLAEGDYCLMLDLDDYLPPFPNMKTLVQASPYVDQFAGARLELIGGGEYTALHLGNMQACPTLFRRHRKHVYGGVKGGDEYLSRLDLGIANWAMASPHICVTDCYNYWHLKHVLDDRSLAAVRPHMGPAFRLKHRWDRPLSAALPTRVKL